MARVLRVVHCGLGPIGQGVARMTLDTEGLQVVGATDMAPDQGGRDLGAVLGLGRKVRVRRRGPTWPCCARRLR